MGDDKVTVSTQSRLPVAVREMLKRLAAIQKGDTFSSDSDEDESGADAASNEQSPAGVSADDEDDSDDGDTRKIRFDRAEPRTPESGAF